MIIRGKFVDILQRRIYSAEIQVDSGIIIGIKRIPEQEVPEQYILPGFIDAHVHIESSMLVPSEFARLAVVHGTVATVSDPHEIANVCGMEGVEYMIENGKKVPFKFHFGAPSCVPATEFETAGSALDSNDVRKLLESRDIYYLSEMMNFPGVLNKDEEVMKKIAAAFELQKPVDGHAPGLRGEIAEKYIAAGISTDHECFTKDEALDKLKFGMKVIIREGSAAKNFEALIDLLHGYPNEIMFCSDDKHPDSLADGHINELCVRAVAKGIDLFNILRAACVNPVLHYRMRSGLLRPGDPADFIIVEDLINFKVLKTYIDGILVAENGKSFIRRAEVKSINHFDALKKSAKDFRTAISNSLAVAIEALDGQLITNKFPFTPLTDGDSMLPDPLNDILKIAVVNRYQDAPVATAFIKNFGLKAGAIASSVAHDSHNIVAVGADDQSISDAVNLIIGMRGGVSFVNESSKMVVPLPIAGLMSNEDGWVVAEKYKKIDEAVRAAGCCLSAPFMTLSFMALLVIPHIKLSDRGLFDGDGFDFLQKIPH
jgi:adenine deaminase